MALQEILGHFVAAAAEADRRFARTGDTVEIRTGIEVWEQLVADGVLRAQAPGELVEAYLAVSMLYARRHEALGRAHDLSLALRYLMDARRHVVPGSFADLQTRMSRAACLLVRFQADRQPEDLDGAIALWEGLIDGSEGEVAALAAANLGRALLVRHDLTGDPGDLHDSRRLLGRASAEMPRDHPALRDVELALRSAG